MARMLCGPQSAFGSILAVQTSLRKFIARLKWATNPRHAGLAPHTEKGKRPELVQSHGTPVLLTTTLRSDLDCGNGSNVPRGSYRLKLHYEIRR
jgi:hypothetical protein